MDCQECPEHVRWAVADLPGVRSVEVFLTSGKARVAFDPAHVDLPAIRQAVERAGYRVPEGASRPEPARSWPSADFARSILARLGMAFGAVLFVVVAGEWFGLLETITARVPWPAGLAVVLLGGYPVFWKVLRAARRGQVLAHTLMTVGAFAAMAVGEWAAAAVMVFFMCVREYVEGGSPQTARAGL